MHAVDVKTVSREALPQVEIPEKWTQGLPCFAITIGVRLRSHTNQKSFVIPSTILETTTSGKGN